MAPGILEFIGCLRTHTESASCVMSRCLFLAGATCLVGADPVLSGESRWSHNCQEHSALCLLLVQLHAAGKGYCSSWLHLHPQHVLGCWHACDRQHPKGKRSALCPYPKTGSDSRHLVEVWCGFMPLARGTAAAGFIFILSMILAAGMPVLTQHPRASALQSVL